MYANNLQHYRLEAGLPQARLADTVGISVQHLQRLEYGKCKPRHETAQNFAKALGVPAEMIFPIDGKEKGGDS